MVGRTLHWISVACCAFVVVSFVLFARSQVSSASSHQAGLIAVPKAQLTTTTTTAVGAPPTATNVAEASTTPAPPPAVHHGKAQPRKFIDGVTGRLESPFTSLVDTGNPWVLHLIPLLLSLAVYGGGIGFLSRWAAGRA